VSTELSQCNTREDVINKVIGLCKEACNPRQRFLLAAAHALSRNPDLMKPAIYYIELYLNNQIYTDAYTGHSDEVVLALD